MAKDFEHDDPMRLGGMALPGDSMDAMAEVFVEELARTGYPDQAILELFRSPFYGAAHAVLTARGEPFVRELIRKVRTQWAPPPSPSNDPEVKHA